MNKGKVRQRKAVGVPCGKSHISPKKKCRVGKGGAQVSTPAGRRVEMGFWKQKPKEPETFSQYDYPGKKAEQKTVSTVEGKIRDLPYERAIAVDSEGNVLFDQGGDKTHVRFTWDNIKQMKGATLTHNHPNQGFKEGTESYKGISFSPDDLRCACLTEVKEMRAVSAGYDHSLKPPKEGWNAKYYRRVVVPAYRREQQKLIVKFGAGVASGEITPDNADARFYHELMENVAKETGMEYKRTAISRRKK